MTSRTSGMARWGALSLLLAVVSACEDSISPDPEEPVNAIQLSRQADTLWVGDSKTIDFALLDSAGDTLPPRPVVWSSSNPLAATVDSMGVIRGVGPGGTTISGQVVGVRSTAAITVFPDIVSVDVLPDRVSAGAGQTLLVIGRDPEGTAVLSLPFNLVSSDPAIVRVIRGADLLAQREGEATLTITIRDRSFQTPFTVTTPAISRIFIYPREAVAAAATERPLEGIVISENLAPIERPISWSTSDSRIATIDSHGVVTAITEGRVTIGAAVGELSDSIQLHVIRYPEELHFMSIVAGNGRTCGLSTTGRAYCWGSNPEDRLGTGQPTEKVFYNGRHEFTTTVTGTKFTAAMVSIPLPVAGGGVYSSLSSGLEGESCALTQSGQAHCWGSALPPPGDTPRFVQLATGDGHTCGVTTEAQIVCRGDNRNGQIGDGTNQTTNEWRPAKLEGEWASVVAGGRQTCGLNVDGEAYCWGDKFGLFQPPGYTSPALVDSSLRFTQLTAATAYTCGLTSQGHVYCWGRFVGGSVADSVPRLVSGTIPLRTIDAGTYHLCGLTDAGEGYCMGRQLYGVLGDGKTDNVVASQLQPILGGLTFTSITAGSSHTCALTREGAGYCWGRNFRGSVGPSKIDDVLPTPHKVVY